MNAAWKVLLIACAIFVTGCAPVTTKYPIGTTAGLIPDTALFGTWKDDVFRTDFGLNIHIVPAGEGASTAFWAELPDSPDKKGSFKVYQLTTTTLGRNHFLNATEVTPEAKDARPPSGSRPYFYTLRNNGRTLKLYRMNQDKVVAAIKSGAIAGTYETQTWRYDDGTTNISYDKVQITAEPAELDAFMAKPEALGLFDIYMKLWKVE
jgi:hypothetical protein